MDHLLTTWKNDLQNKKYNDMFASCKINHRSTNEADFSKLNLWTTTSGYETIDATLLLCKNDGEVHTFTTLTTAADCIKSGLSSTTPPPQILKVPSYTNAKQLSLDL